MIVKCIRKENIIDSIDTQICTGKGSKRTKTTGESIFSILSRATFHSYGRTEQRNPAGPTGTVQTGVDTSIGAAMAFIGPGNQTDLRQSLRKFQAKIQFGNAIVQKGYQRRRSDDSQHIECDNKMNESNKQYFCVNQLNGILFIQ